MPQQWDDIKEVLSDIDFHNLPLEQKRSKMKQFSELQGFDNDHIDQLLGKTFDAYSLPPDKQSKLPLPKDLPSLLSDPLFHQQSLEDKRTQARQVSKKFNQFDQDHQDTLLGKMYDKYAKLPPPPDSPFAPKQQLTNEDGTLTESGKAQKMKELHDIYRTGPANEFIAGTTTGTKGLLESGGGALQWAGHMIGSDTAKEWGKDINKWAEEHIDDNPPPEDMAGGVMEKPWLMADPRWWSRAAGSFVPYATTFAITGAAVTAATAAALPATATLGTIALVAAGANAIINSAFIGSSQYSEEKKAGKSDQDASNSAAIAAWVNLPLSFIAGKLGPWANKAGSPLMSKIFRNVMAQGSQQAGQTAIQNIAADLTGSNRNILEGVPESFLHGGLIGPVVGKAVEFAMPHASVPEALTTLDLQIRAAQKGNRKSVMFTDPSTTPESINGLERFDYTMKNISPAGEEVDVPTTFFYNPSKTNEAELKSFIDKGNLQPLGYIDEKGPETTHVVTLVNKAGQEVISAAVKPENVEAQKELIKEHFPASEPENEGSKLISGPAETILPAIEEQRKDPSIATISKTKELVDNITSGTEKAPEGVTVESNEQKATENKVIDLKDSGKAIVDNMYSGLFQSLSDGKDTFAGVKDPILKAAKPAFDQGLIKSPEDLAAWVGKNYKSTGKTKKTKAAKLPPPPPVEKILPQAKSEDVPKVGEKLAPPPEVIKEDATPAPHPVDEINKLQLENERLKNEQEKAKDKEFWDKRLAEENERKKSQKSIEESIADRDKKKLGLLSGTEVIAMAERRGQDLDRLSRKMFNKPYESLTPEEINTIGKNLSRTTESTQVDKVVPEKLPEPIPVPTPEIKAAPEKLPEPRAPITEVDKQFGWVDKAGKLHWREDDQPPAVPEKLPEPTDIPTESVSTDNIEEDKYEFTRASEALVYQDNDGTWNRIAEANSDNIREITSDLEDEGKEWKIVPKAEIKDNEWSPENKIETIGKEESPKETSISTPPEMPAVMKEASPELQAQYEALLAEKIRLLEEQKRVMESSQVDTEESQQEAARRNPELKDKAVKFLNSFREGMLIKGTDKKGNEVEYVRRAGGWMKKDKNGKDSGRTTHTETLVDKVTFSPENWEHYMNIGRGWTFTKPEEIVAKPRSRKKAENKNAGVVGDNKEVGGDILETLSAPADQYSPDELLEMKEQEADEIEKARAERLKFESETAARLPEPPTSTVPTETTRKVVVLKKKAKKLPIPEVKTEELPAPIVITPKQEAAAKQEVTQKELPPPVKSVAETDYIQARTNLSVALEQLKEADAEGERRKTGDMTGLTKGGEMRQGPYAKYASSDLTSIRSRLVRNIKKIGETIDQYESEHPEIAKTERPTPEAAGMQPPPPPLATTISDQSVDGRMIVGDEKKTVAYRLMFKNPDPATMTYEPSIMDLQGEGVRSLGITPDGQELSRGQYTIGDKSYVVDFAHDPGNPNGPKKIRLIYDVNESVFNKTAAEATEQIRANIRKESESLRDEYKAAIDIEDKTKLVARILAEGDDQNIGRQKFENFYLALEEATTNDAEMASLEREMDSIVGTIDSTESVMENIKKQAPPNLNEPQYSFGLPREMDIGSRGIRVIDTDDGKPLGIRGIVVRLGRALDVPVRFKITAPDVPTGRKRPMELFRPLAESIQLNPEGIKKQQLADARDPQKQKLKQINEIDYMSHAVGHYFDLLAFRDGKAVSVNGEPSFGTKHDKELFELGLRALDAGGIDTTNASPKLVRDEGIADYFRQYLTGDRDALRLKYKNFSKLVDETLEKYPVISDIFDQASHDIELYNSSDLVAQFKTNIMRSSDVEDLFRPSFKDRITHGILQFKRLFETRLAPIERDFNRMIKLDPANKEDYEYKKRLWFNEKGKLEEQYLYSLAKGFVNLKNEVVKDIPTLVDVFKKVKNMTDFDAYLYAVNLRDIDKPRLSADGKTLLRQRTIGPSKEQYMATIERFEKDYGQVAKELNKIANAHLKLLVDAGRIDQETYDKIVKSRETYAPLWRITEFMGKQNKARGSGGGTVNLPAGPGFTKGGTGPVYSPVESFLKNILLYRSIARKTALQEHYFSAVDELQGGSRIAEREKPSVVTTKIPGELFVDKLQEMKIDTERLKDEIRQNMGWSDDAPVDFGVEIYKSMINSNPQDLTVIHYRSGKPVKYKMGDVDSYNTVTGSDSKLNAFDKTIFGKIAMTQAKILRAGAILSPSFSIRNLIRDPFSAFVYSDYGFNPYDYSKELVTRILGKDGAEAYHRHAAGFADQMSQDMDSVHKQIQHILDSDKGLKDRFQDKWDGAKTMADKAQLAWDITGGGILAGLQKFGHVTEEATRIGLYNKTLDVLTNGKPEQATPQQIEIAVQQAKDTTLPYHRAGTVGAFLNKYIPFANANFQDISKFMRAHTLEHVTAGFKEGTSFRSNTILKGIAYHLPLALLTFMLGKDDEKIQSLPSWRKAGFWNINLKGLVGHDFVMSIPKSFLLGQIYGTSVETALNFAHNHDPNAFNKWAEGAWETIAPNILPTTLTPLVENYFNWNIFRKSQLENQTMQQIQSEYRANPNTSAFASMVAHGTQWTGKLFNSPIKIDNLIRGWTGSLGSGTVDALGYGMAKLGGAEVAPVKKTLGEIFPLSSLSVGPYTPSDYVRKFYDASEKADQIVKTFNDLENDHPDTDEGEQFYNKNEDAIDYYRSNPVTGHKGAMASITKAKRYLGKLSQDMARIKAATGMTSEQKQQELLELSQERDEYAKEKFEEIFLDEEQKAVF